MHIFEELCKPSILRTIRYLYKKNDYASLYEIRKNIKLNVRRETLEKMVSLDILIKEKYTEKYHLNYDNAFLLTLIEFMNKVNYDIE